jgi:hypothetical protein
MEIWKDIKGYEGFYQVSNLGNVRSVIKKKVLKPQPNSKGYLRVQLKANGVGHHFLVHRLVALHFVDNPCESKNNIVNHLDCDFLNNSADNLEWTTLLGNTRHAIKCGRMKRTKEWLKHLRESNERNGKSVVGTNIKTGETIYFACLNDCAKAGFQPSCVCNCCKGIRKTHKGYKWGYAQ